MTNAIRIGVRQDEQLRQRRPDIAALRPDFEIRATYGVHGVIVRDAASAAGFQVVTVFPVSRFL